MISHCPKTVIVALAFATASCTEPSVEPTRPTAPQPTVTAGTNPDAPPSAEPHLADIRQLTFGGENAEAYWAWSGKELILQAKVGEMKCDAIFRMPVDVAKPALTPVSSGKGATTCSYFMPGDKEVIYASTHLGGDACPPKPDQSKGYVWALYDSYDIFKSGVDGKNPVRLTDAPGYDAEATVCGKDGSILFTSVRDGDIDLYRMDADGKNVKRLTSDVGYDGGAFYSSDCSKIVWRASRPKGKALDDYKGLLKEGLVRPSKLELYVANADGSEARQVTYLNAAAFGPYFAPGNKRILFSSNLGDPKGREFDIWAINVDGTQLERITATPGFDGFPMFSPDGKTLAFSSNRATAEGKQDTNVFLARWVDGPIVVTQPTAADRVAKDAAWLADPARQGRGVGSQGLEAAGAFIEERFKSLGLEPAGDGSSFRQSFDVVVGLTGSTKLTVEGKPIEGANPLAFSSSKAGVSGSLVFAGYGIQTDGWDDYKQLDVKDKIVLVRRFTPDVPKFEKSDMKRRHGDLRRKARLAKERGAKGIVVVDYPEAPKGNPAWKMPDEAKQPSLSADGASDAQIVAVIAPRAALSAVIDRLAKARGSSVETAIDVALKAESKTAFNVLARLRAKTPDAKRPGTIVIGAHYDHLGDGGHGSLAPGETKIHPGADDNASGTAALLEIAKRLKESETALSRDVVLMAFSGEERGVLGSTYLTKNPPKGLEPASLSAMVNLDMVGRVRKNKIEIVGHDTAKELRELVEAACGGSKIGCDLGKGGGFGPSDHSPFYGAGVPVLFLFSGPHEDYHKPSDTADKLNIGGIAETAALVADLAARLAAREGKLSYMSVASPPPKGDARSFGASLGTVPDYSGSLENKGVLLAGVRPGGAAEIAGMKRGDLLTRIGKHDIASVEDLMFVLGESKPGEKAKASVVRDGKPLQLDITFQESKRH